MTAAPTKRNLDAIQIGRGDRAATSFPLRPDVAAQLAGLDALKSLATTQPLKAVDAEMLVRPRRVDRAHHGGFRRLAGKAWEHRERLVVFAANGLIIFAVGLLIQVILVRYAGMRHIPSYIAQTIASVQLNFLLSRYTTWRDRDVTFPRALARFNFQQLTVTGLGMAGYAGLELLGMNYITANVVVTVVLAPLSFLSSHLWSLTDDRAKDALSALSMQARGAQPAGTTANAVTDSSLRRVLPELARHGPNGDPRLLGTPGRHSRWQGGVDAIPRPQAKAAKSWQHRLSSTIVLVAVVLFTGAALWAAVNWPPMRYLVVAAWMTPLAELALLATGQAWFRYGYREAPPGTFAQLIIQVTTAGHEHGRVTEIIKQVRDYRLEMDHQIWVVTEPGSRADYPLADLVLIVPPDFSARSAKKARALEYSRHVRVSMGLDRADVKILFNDDDVSLTRGYIERAFAADYDICEGIVTPRTGYAVRPFWHFAISHADDIRTHACLVYCSVFQGILNRPVHVHGEGLTVTGAAEALVTWDIPLIASEDLAFGQRAARAKGLRWGWFHEYAEVTSPWSLRDFMIQRSRWLWGDIHAIGHRDVMPLGAALMVTAKYLAGILGLVFSAAGLYLRFTGRIPATSPILSYAKLSIVAWVGVIFACGWIGAGSATSARNNDSRMLAGAMAVLMMPISVALTFAAVFVPLAEGDPRTFRVIRKTRSAP